ncbi:hypothetical protein GQ44DRAFT_715722 [Phaeosphaeriaceae sp. PMI808]|nr:hypothetical protein GQ44DRAFT_715722 [Phaeosphaeriaceae sp. PMI808]
MFTLEPNHSNHTPFLTMGSKLSKAVHLDRKAVASASVETTSSPHDTLDDTNERPCQDPSPRLPAPDLAEVIAPINLPQPDTTRPSISISHDDLHVAISVTPSVTLRRRNSEPDMNSHAEILRRQPQPMNMADVLAELRSRNTDNEIVTPPLPLPPPPPVMVEPETPVDLEIQCLICCDVLPGKTDANHAKEAIYPCKSCDNPYCANCVKKMFMDACTDMSRMPPQCCYNIQIHHAKPLLTKEELATFRSKHEEWSTRNPMYCPVPVCSAFIPNRLLPKQMRTQAKERADSGIGTPTSEAFACPTCTADICPACRQQAHPGSICVSNESGLDAETAKLLKSWGYKKCPRCGQGVKRMYGCNHMECLCGAHFCWACMGDLEYCNGNCVREEYSEDEDEDEDSHTQHDPVVADVGTEANATVELPTTTPAPTRRPNLDDASANDWESPDYDFGEEPTDPKDNSWTCTHKFSTPIIPSQPPSPPPRHRMPTLLRKTKMVPARPSGVQSRSRRRSYTLPRGLFRSNATVGTAPHLTLQVDESQPAQAPSTAAPMDDVRFEEQIVDTYGTIIHTTPLPLRRRASDTHQFPQESRTMAEAKQQIRASSVSAPTFSFAHECEWCHVLLCDACRVVEKAEAEERSARNEYR